VVDCACKHHRGSRAQLIGDPHMQCGSPSGSPSPGPLPFGLFNQGKLIITASVSTRQTGDRPTEPLWFKEPELIPSVNNKSSSNQQTLITAVDTVNLSPCCTQSCTIYQVEGSPSNVTPFHNRHSSAGANCTYCNP
jgi:hypothetical protein